MKFLSTPLRKPCLPIPKELIAGTVFFFFLPYLIQAANPRDVVINEIAWMGGEVSYNEEWIELYNNTDFPANLDGWKLKAADGTPEINLAGEISSSSFYLLERTDDNTVSNIKADLIYKGVLGNSGEILELYDNLGNLIDKVDCSSGWFSGDNSTKQTMARINSSFESVPNNWRDSQNPGGTPKVINSLISETPSSQENPLTETEPESLPQKGPQSGQEIIIYPSGVFINEILPSPSGPDETEEWIEFFNQNEFEVNLSNWRATDAEGKITSFTFPEGKRISPKGFLVLSRSDTKITLNNSGDGLIFVQPDGKIVDSIDYEKAPLGQSYNKTESGWSWSPILTPGAENIIPASVSENKEAEIYKETSFENFPKLNPEKEIAAIAKQTPEKLPNLLWFSITALIVAIFSGLIILVIKIKLKNIYNKNI